MVTYCLTWHGSVNKKVRDALVVFKRLVERYLVIIFISSFREMMYPLR